MSPDSIAHIILQYRYWALFPIACFEGPLVSILIGFFISLGYFNPFAAYAILLAGDLVPDTIFYMIGRYGKRTSFMVRYGRKIGITPERFATIEQLWKTHPSKTMFMSKLAFGLSTIFLVLAGLVGLPPRTFYPIAILVTCAQYAILMTLGYYFGTSYLLIANTFEGIGLAVAGILILASAYYIVSATMRSRLMDKK